MNSHAAPPAAATAQTPNIAKRLPVPVPGVRRPDAAPSPSSAAVAFGLYSPVICASRVAGTNGLPVTPATKLVYAAGEAVSTKCAKEGKRFV